MTDNVIAALARVSREVGAIEKARSPSSGPKYDYRGIEDVLNAMHGPLHRNGVVIVPRVTRAEMVERKNGQEAQMLVEYRIYGPGGTEDFIDTSVFATGMDQGDKATGKALSYAYKSMAFQLLCIPTDAIEDNELTNQVVQPLPKEPERQWADGGEERWKGLADRLRALPDDAKSVVLGELGVSGLFAGRKPNTPFDDLDLDQIGRCIKRAEVERPGESEVAAGPSPAAMEVVAAALSIKDPLNLPEGYTVEPWMWELAEVTDLDAHDWKATATAAHMRQKDILDRAKKVAEEAELPEPDRLTDLHGLLADELRAVLISDPSPF